MSIQKDETDDDGTPEKLMGSEDHNQSPQQHQHRSRGPLLGGFSEKDIDNEDREFFNSVKSELCSKVQASEDSKIELKSVKTQVVAGRNYVFNFTINDEPHEAKVWQKLPHVGGHEIAYVRRT